MHDALPVSRVNDLGDPLEQRHEAVERDRPLRLDQVAERAAANQLHRDPQHPIGLGARRVRVRGVRMVESRREPRLAQEPLDGRRGTVVANDLDRDLALEPALLGAVDHALTAAIDELDQPKLAELATDQLVSIRRGADHACRLSHSRRYTGSVPGSVRSSSSGRTMPAYCTCLLYTSPSPRDS